MSDLERAKLELQHAQLAQALGTDEAFDALLAAQHAAQHAARAEQKDKLAALEAQLIEGPPQ